MREISLHLLDIAENSIAAGAKTVELRVHEDLAGDRLWASVRDDGRGMDADTVARVIDPFVTSRSTRKVGLGIPLLKAAAEACNGSLTIDSQPGRGTTVNVVFQHSHIDRMPLGDITGTFLTLLVANPGIHWWFRYSVTFPEDNGCYQFDFDDQPVKEQLGGLPLSEPEVLSYLRNYIEEGVAEVRRPHKKSALKGVSDASH